MTMNKSNNYVILQGHCFLTCALLLFKFGCHLLYTHWSEVIHFLFFINNYTYIKLNFYLNNQYNMCTIHNHVSCELLGREFEEYILYPIASFWQTSWIETKNFIIFVRSVKWWCKLFFHLFSLFSIQHSFINICPVQLNYFFHFWKCFRCSIKGQHSVP